MRVLVAGGSPERASIGLLRKAACGCDAIVAVDGGMDALRAAGLRPQLFCGDVDSSSPAIAAAIDSGDASYFVLDGVRCEIERYNPHKDATDLDLALRAIESRYGAVDIVATCLSGGRPDHMLAALGRLCAWPGSVELREDGFIGRILHAGDTWDVGPYRGCRFSFVPLSCGCVVSESRMRWELDHVPLPLLSDRGISNELDFPDGSIACHAGTLGAWVFIDMR